MDGLLWAWAYVLAKVVQSDSTVRRLPAFWAFASPPLVFYCIFLYLSGFVRCSYFYLVIDRAADGDETVHFMNLVDEADLLALMEEEDIPQPEPELQPEPEPEPEPMPEPEPEKEEGGAGKFVLVLLVLAGIAGGGGYFWMKLQQKKREAEENKPDPDADYREDEDEIILPDGEPEPDVAQDEEAERKAYQTSDGYEETE